MASRTRTSGKPIPETPRSGSRSRKNGSGPQLRHASDWRTTDADEIAKRVVRAREEIFRFSNTDPETPIFSNFEVRSQSGMTYRIEIRDLISRQFSCTCTDFRASGLGTCKHIESLLLHLARRNRAEYKGAQRIPSPRVDLVVDHERGLLRIERNLQKLPAALRDEFDETGLQRPGTSPEELLEKLEGSRFKRLRVSQDVPQWIESRRRERDRILSRRDYESGVATGRHPEHVTASPLFPYQREGMLHLAFGERTLLADEMGLGKTIQAIAACALLHHLGKARRALIVTPVSLKTEWEEQIKRFTPLELRIVFGGRALRTRMYEEPSPPFFTIANYEQVVADSLDINARLRPDIVVLDEAQRIKNWSTKVAQAVKRLQSRYAFVLTGTPIENRIDELRSIVDFLNPHLLGTLFRFNREYYVLDDKGRPIGYKNLDKLRERIRPILLRRRKTDVETELPDRTDKNLFVPLTKTMREEYAPIEYRVRELIEISSRRTLSPDEQDLLMILLNMMRMICDSPGLLKNNPSRECPKLAELAKVLDGCLSEPDVKVIVFSEWTGMLRRVREWAEAQGIRFAWHTGDVPQQKRRAEILMFRNDPDCRLFLSTDSGGVGLNLQNASVVINCDLPWNPAKLEQRIARAWRKNQVRPVTVINLIAQGTIEHGMLGSLEQKMNLAEGILDGKGDLTSIKLKGGRQSMLKRLEQAMAVVPGHAVIQPAPPSDPAAHFAARARQALGKRFARCEETWLPGSDTPVLLAVLDRGQADEFARVQEIFSETDWPGKRPTLQVIDPVAWEALQRLAEAGMISIHTRATRPLISEEGTQAPPPLSAEELARIDALRSAAGKKRRAAKALLAEELTEEAENLLQSAERDDAAARLIESGGAGQKDQSPQVGNWVAPESGFHECPPTTGSGMHMGNL